VTRRRGNGEGSIYQRANGVWAGAVSLPDGRRRFLYGRTREDVRRKLAGLLRAQDEGTLTDSRGQTVGDFLDQWLAEVVKPSVRRWTYVGYEVHVRLHIKPLIGRIPLEKLTPLNVQSLINRKLESGLSPKSVRYIRGTLRTALNHAIRWGMVSRNAAALVDGPRVERFEIEPFTPDEARRFLGAIKGDRLEALYSVALTMGLRQGEALGLRWQDVDLDVGYLRVNKQLQRIDGRLQLQEPKTKSSRRTLVMPASIVTGLREHRRRQSNERARAGSTWQDSDLIFTRPTGQPLEGTTVSRHFHVHLERAGLAQRRFHDLRHSCATLLLVQGVSPRVVMEVLGHSEIAMTMDTYSHVIPELRRDAAERMNALLNGQERS
jgi:integrase